ncbi:MAG: hypothetical protein AAB458_01055 [Patescibacteria group bacterium]
MKRLFIPALVLLCLPFISNAVFNDVILETTTILDVNGYELTIYGSSALIEQIIINPTNFVVTLPFSSAIIVASADGVGFTHNGPEGYVTSEYCSGGESRLGLLGGTVTITVTPSGTCTDPDAGGGGGGSSSRVIPPPVALTQPEVVVAPETPVITELDSAARIVILERLRELILELIALLLAQQGLE